MHCTVIVFQMHITATKSGQVRVSLFLESHGVLYLSSGLSKFQHIPAILWLSLLTRCTVTWISNLSHILFYFCHCLLNVWSQVVVVLFYVLFVCKSVLYYCHWVSTPLQLKIYIISYHIKSIVQSVLYRCMLQLQSQGRLEYLCF